MISDFTDTNVLQKFTLAELAVEVNWDDFFSAATDRLEEWGQAFVRYHGQKIEVEVDSTFTGGDGRMWANVTALEGFPFLSADVQAQGETFGAFNCNGYRVRADLISIGSPYLAEPPAPESEADAAEAAKVDEWLATDNNAATYGTANLPPVVTWEQAMQEREKDFNRRYYNNPDGKPEFRY